MGHYLSRGLLIIFLRDSKELNILPQKKVEYFAEYFVFLTPDFYAYLGMLGPILQTLPTINIKVRHNTPNNNFLFNSSLQFKSNNMYSRLKQMLKF